MTLDAFDDDLLRLRADLERQNARIERFAAHLMTERVVIEDERFGRFTAAVHDRRDFAGFAQAAAIGAAELWAWLAGQFECGFRGFHGWGTSRKPRILAGGPRPG